MTRLGQHLELDLSAERSERLWRGVSARLRRERRAPVLWLAPAFASVLAFTAGWLLSPDDPRPGWASLVTRGAPTSVQLAEGSRLSLDADSRLELREGTRERVALRLERGRVECDVAARPERSFSVTAGGFDVVARGTRFSVDVGDGTRALAVAVEEGKVVILRAGSQQEQASLVAGQRWSVVLSSAAASASASVAPVPSSEALDAGPAQDPSAGALRPAEPGLTTREEQAQAAARLLLDRGNLLRREGNLIGAAQAYEALLTRHPGDPRAGLAAFELGRLRMDRLGDLPGAIRALERAARLLRDPGLREDAMARLVTALDAARDVERCLAARAAYLESHPAGIHVRPVASACGVSD